VTSVTGIDRPAQNAAFAFATTHWTVVREAQGDSPAAQAALEKLCRTYWRPIFAFLRRQGRRPEEAEDKLSTKICPGGAQSRRFD